MSSSLARSTLSPPTGSRLGRWSKSSCGSENGVTARSRGPSESRCRLDLRMEQSQVAMNVPTMNINDRLQPSSLSLRDRISRPNSVFDLKRCQGVVDSMRPEAECQGRYALSRRWIDALFGISTDFLHAGFHVSTDTLDLCVEIPGANDASHVCVPAPAYPAMESHPEPAAVIGHQKPRPHCSHHRHY